MGAGSPWVGITRGARDFDCLTHERMGHKTCDCSSRGDACNHGLGTRCHEHLNFCQEVCGHYVTGLQKLA